MKTKPNKSLSELLCKTTSKTFKAYHKEMRRHELALQRIYANDKQHKHVPEEVGSFSQVWPKRRLLVTLYRCAVCMKDLPDKSKSRPSVGNPGSP